MSVRLCSTMNKTVNYTAIALRAMGRHRMDAQASDLLISPSEALFIDSDNSLYFQSDTVII